MDCITNFTEEDAKEMADMGSLPCDLYRFGFYQVENGQERLEYAPIKRVMDYILHRFEKAKKINRNRSSYGLKHVVERGIGAYVANGELIAAMLLLGFTHSPDGINAMFNVTEQSVLQTIKEQANAKNGLS